MFYVLMFVIGTVVGSYLCCSARRMRAREMIVDTKRRASSGKSAQKLGKWSVCLSCGRRLKWWEKIPIASWVFLRGRCHECGARIGTAEIWSEILSGVMMVLLTVRLGTFGLGAFGFWELPNVDAWGWGEWILVVIFGCIAMYLAIYDGLYGELPGLCLTFLWICAILVVILQQWSLFSVGWTWGDLLGVLGGIVVLGGVYLMLFVASRGKWVGDGDFILAGAMGAVLGSAWLSLVALFVANAVACVVMLPAVMRRRERTVHMGPFLLIGFVVAYAGAEWLTGLMV